MVASFIKKDVDYSTLENRSMEFFRWPNMDSVISGQWFDDFEKYNLDQVAGRDFLVKANTRLLRTIGKRQMNRVTACDEGAILMISYDFPAPYKIDPEFTDSVLLPVSEAALSYGGQFYYMNLYPRNIYFWDQFPYHRDETVDEYFLSNDEQMRELSSYAINTVDTYGITKEHSDEYLFFLSDHHYTFKCAYYAYRTLLDAINAANPEKAPLEYPMWSDMKIIRPKGNFWGSLVAHLGDVKYNVTDYIEYALPDDFPSKYTRLEDGEVSDIPLIRQDDTVEYGWFMNGDYGNTVIKTYRPDLPSILIIGCSSTDAIELMAIYDFNEMHSIDPRIFEGDIAHYVRDAKCDYVVVQDLFELE